MIVDLLLRRLEEMLTREQSNVHIEAEERGEIVGDKDRDKGNGENEKV